MSSCKSASKRILLAPACPNMSLRCYHRKLPTLQQESYGANTHLFQLFNDVVLGVATVDDKRDAGLDGDRRLPPQHLLLSLTVLREAAHHQRHRRLPPQHLLVQLTAHRSCRSLATSSPASARLASVGRCAHRSCTLPATSSPASATLASAAHCAHCKDMMNHYTLQVPPH